MQQITIMTPKRGPGNFNPAAITETLKSVRTVHVTDPSLPSMQIATYDPYTVGVSAGGKSTIDVPSLVFPMNSTHPEEFVQTVTTCDAARPILNLEAETWKGFYEILYRGVTPDLRQKHSVYIALLRDRHAVLVVPAEHPQAANLIFAYREQLITHPNGSPIAVEYRTLAGDGFWRKSRTLLSASLWSLIFHDSEVLAHVDDFFVKEPAPAEESTTAGTRRPRTASAEETPVVEREVRQRRTLGSGAIVQDASAGAPVARTTDPRGTTPQAMCQLRLASILRMVMNDEVSDRHDVVFAAAAITTIRSHLTGHDFAEFTERISMTGGPNPVPIIVAQRPAEAVAERIMDVAPTYGRSIVDALNTLADLM